MPELAPSVHVLVPTDHGWRIHCGDIGTDASVVPLTLRHLVTCPGCRQWPHPALREERTTGRQQRSRSPETEQRFMDRVIAAAKASGWLVYHTHDARRSAPGFPDLVLCQAGRQVLFVECKTETGRLTPAQIEWMATLQASDRTVYAEVWRPYDWERILRLLRGCHARKTLTQREEESRA